MATLFREADHCEAWLHAIIGNQNRILSDELNCHGGTTRMELRAFNPDVGATPGDGCFFEGVLQPLYVAQRASLMAFCALNRKGLMIHCRWREAAGSAYDAPPGYRTGEDSTLGERAIDMLVDFFDSADARTIAGLGSNGGRLWHRLAPEVDNGPGTWPGFDLVGSAGVFGPTFDSGETDPNGTEDGREKLIRWMQSWATRMKAEASHVRLCSPGIVRPKLLAKNYSSLSTANQFRYISVTKVLTFVRDYLSTTADERDLHAMDIHFGSFGVNDCFACANAVRNYTNSHAGQDLCRVLSWETGVVNVPADPTAPTADEYVQMASELRNIYDGDHSPGVRGAGLFEANGFHAITFRPNTPESGDFVASSVYTNGDNPGTHRSEIWPTVKSICSCANERVGD